MKQASSTKYISKPRLPAARAVASTALLVMTPAMKSVVWPADRSRRSNSFPAKALLVRLANSRLVGAVRGVREAGVVAHVVDRQFALTPGGEKVCDVRFGERMIAVPMLPPPGMVDGVLDIYDNQSA